jgi:hypothetical protein
VQALGGHRERDEAHGEIEKEGEERKEMFHASKSIFAILKSKKRRLTTETQRTQRRS